MENQVLEKNLEQLKKELRATRIFCIISSILTCALLIGGIYVYGQMRPVLGGEEIADRPDRSERGLRPGKPVRP